MSWTSGSYDVDTTTSLTVGREVEIGFLLNPLCPNSITLVIGESIAEVSFDPSTVETLRDKADKALRELREAVAKRKADAAAQREPAALLGAAGVVP
ncbi:MAG: hypothetical protein GEV28_16580 [Actinophytocola sp.]|uniref:hypothetical protein n=1 Tax=Actinophytocola sp. TaxID=1872138 RepID=UPI001321E39E|nr:hypothetical protein [Actinophytocola sp.]MPZ81915.1 hypothetical protein [Actinophytocola sp.]